MFPITGDPAWFAVQVRPNCEFRAESALRTRHLETYLPTQKIKRHWSDRIKELDSLLFPGYVFCRFSYADRMRVLTSPGIHSIVGVGKSPLPVDESELDAVRALIASGRPIVPWTYIRAGQQVVVRDGPLQSLRGVIVRVKDSWRVVVSIEALTCSVAVEIDAELLAPLNQPYGLAQA